MATAGLMEDRQPAERAVVSQRCCSVPEGSDALDVVLDQEMPVECAVLGVDMEVDVHCEIPAQPQRSANAKASGVCRSCLTTSGHEAPSR